MRIAVFILLAASLTAAQLPSASQPAEVNPDTGKVIVPAGTKLPVIMKAGINTKSAQPGDSIYCETTFPIVHNNRILIPVGTWVQGTITSVKRPGRVKGRAEVLMHFTTMIFPNGYTVQLPGALDSLPGADTKHVKDKEGTVQADSSKGKDAGTIAGAGATGAVIGAAASGAKGAGIGAGIGGLAGLAVTMLSRGNDVVIPQGSTIDMVLQRPLELEEERLAANPGPMTPTRGQNRTVRHQLTPPPDTR